ncbi:hypothetical protein [Paenibacillus tyrfis]|uniref:hypothetical protein n=1 Tax=Paenibacillus tyrfis TaxID=1501230 RepID=UPI0024921461|nr:hypothetical protein [Paenibacillus tyrfis]
MCVVRASLFCKTGREEVALRKTETCRPHALVLDVMMRKLSPAKTLLPRCII